MITTILIILNLVFYLCIRKRTRNYSFENFEMDNSLKDTIGHNFILWLNLNQNKDILFNSKLHEFYDIDKIIYDNNKRLMNINLKRNLNPEILLEFESENRYSINNENILEEYEFMRCSYNDFKLLFEQYINQLNK